LKGFERLENRLVEKEEKEFLISAERISGDVGVVSCCLELIED